MNVTDLPRECLFTENIPKQSLGPGDSLYIPRNAIPARPPRHRCLLAHLSLCADTIKCPPACAPLASALSASIWRRSWRTSTSSSGYDVSPSRVTHLVRDWTGVPRLTATADPAYAAGCDLYCI